MPLTCPRCDVPLSAVRATVQAGPPVELDLCDRCKGLWIDGPKLAAVCPTVSDLPGRKVEIALLGRQGAGIAKCPRCEQVPYEFHVLDIPIDFCAGCTGVWLDGSEYGEIDFATAPSGDAPRGGPYRASASRAMQTGEVACAACGTKAPLRNTYMWEWGLICRACFATKSQRAADRRAEEAKPDGVLAETLVRLLDAAIPEPGKLQQ